MIIGFAGRARHGKDYCAGHAQRLLRDKAVTRGFAVELKSRVKVALRGVPGLDEAIAEKPPWMRAILQTFGENVRQADRGFWVNTLMAWFRGSECLGRHLLIPDVRYLNEVNAIKDRGGRVIKVVRTHKIVWDISEMGEAESYKTVPYEDPNTDPNHPSEASIDLLPDDVFDRIFHAESGMLETLERNTEEALRDWGLLDG